MYPHIKNIADKAYWWFRWCWSRCIVLKLIYQKIIFFYC